ncbi:MAG TPA: helix-turn-helix transcriptional regulator [Gemmatimonadales bacterium]|nr:helix-turn-helix transcriptional regulator [Gemmatimonadales bacterium]
MVRRRLKELKRTPRELAEAIQVSEEYVGDLLAGRRAPPAPGRTDLYDRMTKFLRLHRNDLPTCAKVERESMDTKQKRPDPKVRALLLELCEPVKAKKLDRRFTKRDQETAALDRLVAQRLLEVAQGFVRRQLDDEVGIRVAANREGVTYLQMRMRLLEFLDATVESLSVTDYDVFIRPRIGFWEIDLETNAMRIVLRSQEPAPRQRRAMGF